MAVDGCFKQFLSIFAMHSFWATDGQPVDVCAFLLASVSLNFCICICILIRKVTTVILSRIWVHVVCAR